MDVPRPRRVLSLGDHPLRECSAALRRPGTRQRPRAWVEAAGIIVRYPHIRTSAHQHVVLIEGRPQYLTLND